MAATVYANNGETRLVSRELANWSIASRELSLFRLFRLSRLLSLLKAEVEDFGARKIEFSCRWKFEGLRWIEL